MSRPIRFAVRTALALAALLAGPGAAPAQGAAAIADVSSPVGGDCTRFVVRGLSAAADRGRSPSTTTSPGFRRTTSPGST